MNRRNFLRTRSMLLALLLLFFSWQDIDSFVQHISAIDSTVSSFKHSSFFRELPIIELQSFDLKKMKVVKKTGVGGNEERAVYFCKDENLFYKIWPKTFWRSAHFLACIKNGFYDKNNTPLIALIYDDASCQGYVTEPGLTVNQYEKLLKKAGTICPIADQVDLHYIEFYHTLLKKTKEFQYAYIDPNIANIVVINDEYKIIDLEPILPLDKINGSFYNSPSYPHDYRTQKKHIAFGGSSREGTS